MLSSKDTKLSSLFEYIDSQSTEEIPINFTSHNSIKMVPNGSPMDDSGLVQQKLKDIESNRGMRETISGKIIVMMVIELLFTAVLLFGLFIIPVINSLSPKITINLPPVVLTLSIVLLAFYIFKSLGNIPFVYFSSKKMKLKRKQIDISLILKIMLGIVIFCSINFLERRAWTVNFNEIKLSNQIIQMILFTTETIFIKTTILAGMIIGGLFKIKKIEKS